jgi:hypothetical protein
MSEWAEATTISMLGPVTCSALTVISPVFPLGELVCSLTMTLMPPGKEMATFGLTTRTGCPATTRPTSSEFPVTAACPLLQLALEFDFHEIGSDQTTQQAQVRDRRLRLTAGATARRGAAQHVSRDQTQDVDTRQRRLQIPAACRKRSGIRQCERKPHRTCSQSHA